MMLLHHRGKILALAAAGLLMAVAPISSLGQKNDAFAPEQLKKSTMMSSSLSSGVENLKQHFRSPPSERVLRVASAYHDVSTAVLPVNYGGRHPFERKLQLPANFSFDEFYSVLSPHDYGTRSEFAPIRIRFLTELFLDGVESRNETDKAAIETIANTVLPQVAETWSKYLSVYPVQGPLPFTVDVCGGEFPPSFPNFTTLFDNYLQNGVDDADMVVVPLEETCEGPGQIAAAASCNRDQFDRPTIAFIQFCLPKFDPTNEDGLFDAILATTHEMGHALGLANTLFSYFRNATTGEPLTPRDETGAVPRRTVRCVDGSESIQEFPSDSTIQMKTTTPGVTGVERIHYEVVTPRVQAVVRNIYDCPTLDGARLENDPTQAADCAGTHWHERQFFNALMSAFFNGQGDGQADVLSPLTLALLEDSGWYKVSYEGIGHFPYGLGLGCEFATQDCIVNETIPDYGQGIFCAAVNKFTEDWTQESVFCDPSHTAFSYCDLIGSDDFFFVPDDAIYYFANQSILAEGTGWDFCPLPVRPAGIVCTDENTPPGRDIFEGETYGPDSRCVNTVREGMLPRPACLTMECDEENYQVILGGRVCEFDGQMHNISLADGSGTAMFECPRITLVCPDLVCPGACSGRGTCNYSLKPPQCECFDTSDDSPLCNKESIAAAPTMQPTTATDSTDPPASSPTMQPATATNSPTTAPIDFTEQPAVSPTMPPVTSGGFEIVGLSNMLLTMLAVTVMVWGQRVM